MFEIISMILGFIIIVAMGIGIRLAIGFSLGIGVFLCETIGKVFQISFLITIARILEVPYHFFWDTDNVFLGILSVVICVLGVMFGAGRDDSDASSASHTIKNNSEDENVFGYYQKQMADSYEKNFAFVDYSGAYRKWGDDFIDSKGGWRKWGEGFYDSKGNWINWGEGFYDGKGNWCRWGEGFYDAEGNWVRGR